MASGRDKGGTKIMLIAKFYGLMWLVVAGAAGLLYAAGAFTFGATITLGFLASVLAGAGMLAVYPALMNEDIRSQRVGDHG